MAKHIEGIHNDGAVDAIITFEKDGNAVHDFAVIPFSGVRPVESELNAAAAQLTGCATAKVTSYAIVDLGYGEDQYTCPNSHHIEPMNAATEIQSNFYEPKVASRLDLANVVVAKIKEVRLNQTTRTGQTLLPKV